MDVGELQRAAVQSVKDRGFYETDNVPLLARHGFLSAQRLRFCEEWGEFCRALRKEDGDGIRDELADVQIVLFQIAEALGVDLATAVAEKMARDEKRGLLHGG